MKYLTKKNLITLGCVVLSSLIMATVTKTFVRPANLLSGGFMGISLLVNMLGELVHLNIPIGTILLCINIPVALFCAKRISKRFVFFSLTQVFLTSMFLEVLPSYPLFDEQILNVIFGGYVWGMSIVIALKGNASSGGTDFIALYVGNKSGKEIWMQVFVFNCCLLLIFGYVFGFEKAGYSILFQFISTKTISTFHTRYKRVMLQIFTQHKDQVLDTYILHFHHGITALDGFGGYSRESVGMLIAVVASYEVDDVIHELRQVDPNIIINVTKSEKYVGRFYNKPIE